MAQHRLAYKLLWYTIFCLQQRVRIPEAVLPDIITLNIYGHLALFPLHFPFIRQFNLPGMAQNILSLGMVSVVLIDKYGSLGMKSLF